MTELVDLSQEFYEGMPVYPGLVPTRLWEHQSHADTRLPDGTSYSSCGMALSDHAGTHVDAPNHIDPGAASVDRIPLSACYGPALCLSVSGGDGPVTSARLAAAVEACGQEPRRGDVLLLHTGVHDRFGGTPRYLTDYHGLDGTACEWVVDHGVAAVGVDQPSPDGPDGSISPAHLRFTAENVLIYENLANLGRVAGRRFVFAGFPVLLRGSTGAPVRAVAIMTADA
ncbi:cyclase family protein [Actinophytocola oryzae]|uniref:Kynurenine formamidase n=1 Tax=Actinophytocola oryzae TaxID=502181 RepID=A0A4R7VHM5_9PSEU|nr:cyclase family protein [Actinophytocola oryzae]TDV48655.1 kynurenine formamidase [Actinophytocola oryzae]